MERKASKAQVHSDPKDDEIRRERSPSVTDSRRPSVATKKPAETPVDYGRSSTSLNKRLPTEKRNPGYASGTISSQSRLSRSYGRIGPPAATSQQVSMSSLDFNREMEKLPPESDTASVDFVELMSGNQTPEVKLAKLKEAYMKQRDGKHKMREENKKLRQHVSVLNKRMVKDFGKGHPSAQLQMPSTVEVK